MGILKELRLVCQLVVLSNVLMSLALLADDTNPLGPCIVAASAIPDPQRLPLKTTVNGQTLQDGSTSYVVSHA